MRTHARILPRLRQVLDKLGRDQTFALQKGLKGKIGAQDIFEKCVEHVVYRRWPAFAPVRDFLHAGQNRLVMGGMLAALGIAGFVHRSLFMGEVFGKRGDDVLHVLSRECRGLNSIDDLEEMLMLLVDRCQADQQ